MAKLKLDPVKYEIFYNKVSHALHEAKETIRSLSASPITRYAGEIAEAVYLPSGDSVVMASGVLCHVNTVSRAIKHMIKDSYAEDVGFNPGDQFINNDAHIGGLHTPDMLIIAPFFSNGKQVGWVGSFTHIPEVGAIEPGGASPSSRNIYHEGILLPCVKIVEEGTIRRDVFQMMLRAVRDPKAIAIDTKAKIAGNIKAMKGLTRIIDEFGLEFYEVAMAKLFEDSKIQAEQRLKVFRSGKFRSRAYSDYSVGFETGLGVSEVCFDVSKKGDVTLSCPVVSPERKGYNNLALPGTEAIMFSALMTQIFHDLRCNGGTFNAFDIDIPGESVLKASETAAIGMGAIGMGLQTMASLNVALSLACYVSGLTDSIIAGNSALTALFFGGVDQFGRKSANTVTDGLAGGTGARLTKDGSDSSLFQPNPWTDNPDMETIEMAGPLLYLSRNHVPNSGGFGKYRGGAAIESIMVIHDSPELVVGTRGQGGLVSVTYGLFGGYPSSVSVVSVSEENDLGRLIAKKKTLPHKIEDIEKIIGGKHEFHFPSSPSKSRKEGTILSFRNWAGGGVGDPIERDPNSIVKDIKNEVATLDVAEKVYAVSIDEKTLKVDEEGTVQLRKERRKERLSQGVKAREYVKLMVNKRKNRDLPQPVLAFLDEIIPFSAGFRQELEFEEEFCNIPENDIPAPIQPEEELFSLTPYLKVLRAEGDQKVIACHECGYVYCEATENYKLYCLIHDRDPKDIQPGLLGPNKEWMIYREFYCPGCGTQIDVEGTPEGTPILHSIELNL